MRGLTKKLFFRGDARLMEAVELFWKTVESTEGHPLHRALAYRAHDVLQHATWARDVAGDSMLELVQFVPIWIADLKVLTRGAELESTESWHTGLSRLLEAADTRPDRDPRLMVIRKVRQQDDAAEAYPVLAGAHEAEAAIERLCDPTSILRIGTTLAKRRALDELVKRNRRQQLRLQHLQRANRYTEDDFSRMAGETLDRTLAAMERLSDVRKEAIWRALRANEDTWDLVQLLRPDAAQKATLAHDLNDGDTQIADVARSMNRSPSAVHNLLHKARKQLKDDVEEEIG